MSWIEFLNRSHLMTKLGKIDKKRRRWGIMNNHRQCIEIQLLPQSKRIGKVQGYQGMIELQAVRCWIRVNYYKMKKTFKNQMRSLNKIQNPYLSN